jgi:hypothetical protein
VRADDETGSRFAMPVNLFDNHLDHSQFFANLRAHVVFDVAEQFTPRDADCAAEQLGDHL